MCSISAKQPEKCDKNKTSKLEVDPPGEREERETNRQTDRQTDGERDTEGERETERETEKNM